MPIIKAAQSGPLLKEAVVLDLGDLSRQGEAIKAAAVAKAAAIVAEAEARAHSTIKAAEGQGFEQGHAEGLKQGLEEGRAEGKREAMEQMGGQLKELCDGWSKGLRELEARSERLEQEGKDAVLALAIKLGEKLLHRIVEVDASVAVDQLGEALALVLRPMDVTVRIHEADRDALEAALPVLMEEFGQVKHIKLVADEAVGKGGCVVSYGQGKIDATIETKLRRAAELLLPATGTVTEG